MILETTNIVKKFKSREILHSISINLNEGEIVGLVGPNGAGKSTFIKSILGLYHINNGEIKICGYNIQKDLEKALSNVGCIVENPDLYQNISGRKNLEITCLMNNVTTKNIDGIVKFVKLENRIDDKVKTYSLGMKQRLGLAQALMNKPKLLILDEPTNGLDPIGIKELRGLLKLLKEKYNMTILISSHILSEIENVCDRIILIDNGNIIENITIDEIKEKNISLEEEFLSKTTNTIG